MNGYRDHMYSQSFASRYQQYLLDAAESVPAIARVDFVQSKVSEDLYRLKSAIGRVAPLATPNSFRGLLFAIMIARNESVLTCPESSDLAHRVSGIFKDLSATPMETTDEGDALELAFSWSYATYASLLTVAKALLPIAEWKPLEWDPAAYVAAVRRQG